MSEMSTRLVYTNEYTEDVQPAALEFPLGGMWEESAWQVHFDVEVEVDSSITPCLHCHTPVTKVNEQYDKSTYTSNFITCPRVVQAKNEGGCCSTGVCLDCIIEAVPMCIKPIPQVFTEEERWA